MPRRLLHLRPWRRHSQVLAVAGTVYVLYGTALLATTDTEARTSTLRLAVSLIPINGWGLVWIAVGALALASTRWPPQSETWGYAAMSGLAAWWAACYGLGVALMGAPTAGYTACLVWAMVAFLWWGISGLMNPDDPEPHKPIVWDWTIYKTEPRSKFSKRG